MPQTSHLGMGGGVHGPISPQGGVVDPSFNFFSFEEQTAEFGHLVDWFSPLQLSSPVPPRIIDFNRLRRF